MPFLDVGSDRIHYSDEGEGVPVVFVHGSCGGAGHVLPEIESHPVAHEQSA